MTITLREALKPYLKLKKPHAAASSTWNVPDLCKAYRWPTGLGGGGVIAIVELGGGWTSSDVSTFFGKIGPGSTPSITDVSVDGTKNTPGGDADGEVALDIQVAGAAYFAATGKPATIRIYWAQDIATAVRAATKEGCDVCSISWGADEANWGAAAGNDMESAAIAATEAGMVVFAASGDNDSSDGGDSAANVDLPASAPHVIGCGGTTKTSSSEIVWNNDPGESSGEGTGGGYSTLFPMPTWQSDNGAPKDPEGNGRMVPDVAANADPNTGYQIVVGGQWQVVGGTSAVAPLYAGLFAAIGRKLGFIAPTLWDTTKRSLWWNDITSGNNGDYTATTGPDPCTGLGSPIAVTIATGETAAPPAPTPTPVPTPTPSPTPTPVPPAPAPAPPITLVQAQKVVTDSILHSRSGGDRMLAQIVCDALAKAWH